MEKNTNKDISLGDVKKYFTNLFKDILDLDAGVDKWATIEEVKSKQSMSGANAWMLMCSIIIASIGLNLNSQAVIIGAMLISPLMSPILGIGVAVGINDKDALYNALMHLFSALVISLICSTLYFLISPLDDYTEQIRARTEPTILDVFIAIFGGIAGIVSIARKDISTTLPGVAIATALMPPICVTGYGIANGSFDIASKSFYLFFLNTFFVAFATFIIVKYFLKFPIKKYTSLKDRRKNMLIVAFVSMVLTIPSILIFKRVFNELQQTKAVKQFVESEIGENSIFLDAYELINLDDNSNRLILKVYGDSINRSHIPQFEEDLGRLGLTNTRVEIISTTEVNLSKIKQLESQLSVVDNRFNAQMNLIEKNRLKEKEAENTLKLVSNLPLQDSVRFMNSCKAIQQFIPEINGISMAHAQQLNSDVFSKIPIVVLDWDKPDTKDVDNLRKYIMDTYQLDTIDIVFK